MTTFQASDYGALGDGHSNDTQAIQAAIDAASAAGGGTVKLAAGTFIISGENGGAALTLPANVTLEGPAGFGGDAILKLADGADDTSAMLSSTGDHTGARFLTLDGNSAHTTGQVSGWVNGASSGVVLDRVIVDQMSGYGLDLRGEGGQVSVSRAYVENCGIDGIIASGLVNSELSDTTVHHNAGNGLTVTGPLQVLDLTSDENTGHGVLLQGEGASLIGGSISATGLGGVQLSGTQGAQLEYVSFTNWQAGQVQVQADGAKGTLLEHNQFLLGNSSTALVLNDSTGTEVRGNTFNNWLSDGGPQTLVSVVEAGQSDSTRVEGNYIEHGIDAPALSGAASVQLTNATALISHGTAQNDKIFYYTSILPVDRVIYGGAGNDEIIAGVGDHTLIGGAGRDVFWGTRADQGSVTFRYDSLDDSYRTATTSQADQIRFFNAQTDKLDLVSLGFTGLGDGHHGTLALVYNEGKGVTYLKNYDADAAGHRFELGLLGDYRGQLTEANFQTWVDGTRYADTLYGTTGEDTLLGEAGRDKLHAGDGNDRLDGGTYGDRLNGDAGADTFVFSHLSDSQIGATGSTLGRDLVVDFNSNEGDRLDVSKLGFTALGDGTGTTLALSYYSEANLTRLYSTQTDASGAHFEVALSGNQVAALRLGGIDFAWADQGRVVDSSPVQRLYQTGTSGADNLHGGNGEDTISGGAGNDRLDGGASSDRLTGGAGADRLTGGSGYDGFIFTAITDSYRTATSNQSDLITDFGHGRDWVDVAALGYTNLGDGTHGTLKVSYNAASDRTYLRDLTVDAQGRSFQVTFAGDQTYYLTYNHFNWANSHDTALTLLGQSAEHADTVSTPAAAT
ncbi:M10 family metallopeptidase C-terminal domain-containing protein [Pseudomonas sp. RIT-PI-S]|uniref:M10 family metallopeptidase C-terminal domain-containing protein n=1 Tax=Pseudomonas sp. RIT-PI-S TaxID=3035295 RepID=UPI0021D7FF3D|nr:M10 family metallopeptidase C-terminal domain-containing protein [Pseudomonas sp. RIT-PI-S]